MGLLKTLGGFVKQARGSFRAARRLKKSKKALVAVSKIKSGKSSKFGVKGFKNFRRKQAILNFSRKKGVRIAGGVGAGSLALGGAFAGGRKLKSRKKSKSRR